MHLDAAIRRPLLLLAILGGVSLLIAHQLRAPIALDMTAAEDDRYLAQGFYAPEVTAGVTHRWTDGDARVALPGLGSGVPLRLSLNLQEIRPPPLPVNPVTITLNGGVIARFVPGPDLAAYHFDVPAGTVDARGDVAIGLLSDTFRPSQALGTDDARALGLFIDRLAVELGTGFVLPPLAAWLLLVASPLIVYAWVRAMGGSRGAGFALGLLLLVAEVMAVILARPWAGYNAPWLFGTVLVVYLVTLRLRRGARSAAPQASTPAGRIGRPAFAFILAVFLAWRVVLVVIPLAGSSVSGVSECCPQVDPKPVASLWDAAFGHWYRWDAIWYGGIARDGYQYFGQREASNVGFFPLFPLVAGIAMRLSNQPAAAVGPIVSSLFAFGACLLLYRLAARETGDEDTASRSMVYLLAFPASYYLAIGYSEALYLLCVLAAFLWARQGRWGLAGAAAFLAGLTRLHGALLIVPMAYEYLRQRDFQWRRIRLDGLAALGGLLGAAAFNLYLNLQFGQPGGYLSPYFEIQALFFKGIRAEAFPTFPTTTLANYLGGLLNGAPSTEGVAVVAATIALLVLTLEVWVRLPRVFGVYMLTVALFSLMGGDLISMPRFVVPMFPAFIALGLIGRRPWADRAILIVSLALLGALALLFANGYWIA